MSARRIAALLSLIPAAALLPAQPPAPSSPPPDSQPVPTLHVTSREVVLDVVVTDADGNPAHGLKPSGFTILEDGVPQPLASFTEHVASTSAPSASPLPLNTFAVQPPPAEDQTKTVIVLSDPTSWPVTAKMPEFPSGGVANTGYVRDDIAAFLKTAPSTQPVAIVRLDW